MLIKRRGIVLLALLLGLGAAASAGAQPPAGSATSYSQENQLDLNRASLDQIKALPIPGDVAEAIYHYRTYRAYFGSIYDLMEVPGMTPELLGKIRPLIHITPVFELEREELREEERRAQERYYVVQRFLSEEGASEGLVDQYVDRLKFPQNINRMNYFDLVSFQNVSPVDAVAVLKERKMAGRIENQRQLRSANGITYWGYRNLRDFVRYEEPTGPNRLTGYYQFRVYNTPYSLDDLDNLTEIIAPTPKDFDTNTYWGRAAIGTWRPYMTNKLHLRYGRYLRGGVLTHRNLGEEKWDETAKAYVEAQELPEKDTPLGKFKLHSAVVGNYTVAFGQGLVMDATDFYLPRRTGYGYNVRSLGLRGDFSRSDEYTLKGVAAEASLGNVRGTLFYSHDDKDAILNPDHSFNSYFTAVPRFDNDLYAGIREDIRNGTLVGASDSSYYQPMRDVMEEQIVGGNFKYQFLPGTFLGVTGVDMRYHNNAYSTPGADRWNPDPTTLIIDPLRRQEDRDAEITQRYNSMDLGNYRRIWGLEGQSVFKNVSLAGEYGKLETSDKNDALSRIFSKGPEAFTANAYVQYENFNFLALYRDYDVGYDNPYNRAFSENGRYQQTILDGNPYRLNNPYWAEMARGEPQPKAERGWFFTTRYQFSRQFTLTGLEYDTWTRKADGADEQRITVRAEYQPVFPVRFRIRHRISSRHEQRPDDFRNFKSWDSRIEMRVNLSDYDRMSFLYSTSNVQFAVRPRLSGAPGGGSVYGNLVGSRGIPAKALQASLSHNFSDYLTATVSTEVYDGFLYNFEDNEFIVVDGNGFRNWFMVRSRLSPKVSWRFKWTTDHQLARTYVDIRNNGALVNPTPDATNARGDQSAYRFQLDYSF